MQKHNIKNIVKEVEALNKKHSLYLNLLAASNLGLWGIVILNYFLN